MSIVLHPFSSFHRPDLVTCLVLVSLHNIEIPMLVVFFYKDTRLVGLVELSSDMPCAEFASSGRATWTTHPLSYFPLILDLHRCSSTGAMPFTLS
jgi:hypothetical protein